MDLFILDSQLRRIALFDRYESLIWTERFSAYGDFQLVIHSTLEARNNFSPGTKLAINESTRIMQVETVEDKVDAEGRTILTVKGPSLEDVMSDRTAVNMAAPNTPWVFTDTPANIARAVFDAVCRNNVWYPQDNIPFITAGNIYPADNIPEPADVVSIEIKPGTLYDVIQQLCEIFELGFRLVRNADNSQLMFNIYAGNDRTTLQSTLPAVIFSPELDNLSDVSYLTSISTSKNAAFVQAPNGSLMVYADNIDPSIAGFDRRVLYVDASDIDDSAGAGLDAKLLQRGKNELALNTTLSAFDGEIPKNSQYKYHEHYELGDLVEVRNSDKVTNNMRVVEQIFVSDAQGDRSYPTLAVKLLITAGSWYAWPAGGVWDDITDPAVVWDTV